MMETRGDSEHENLTFETAPRYLTSVILEQERPATRLELEILFQRHVVGGQMPKHCLAYFKSNELARLVCLEIYRASVLVKNKPKRLVVHQLASVLGNHIKTIETWVKMSSKDEKQPNKTN